MKCRPGKWLLPAILGAGVPFLGAWLWNTTSLDSALLEKAKASLASAGFDWVNISLDGRDAILTGEGPDDAATQKAAAALLGEYGIRRVDTSAITLAAPLPVPSTPGLVTNNVASTLTGTWAEGIASSLAVGLGDRKFTLGTDKELASDGKGNWTLTPPADLADGSYDVTVEEIDKFKRVVTGAAPGKFVLDRKAPAAPTVDPLVSTSPISRLTGTWAEGDATHLKITVDGTAYEKGAAAALHTESGKWTLDLPAPLGEGPHKVMTESSDEAGNAAGSAPDVQVVVDTTPSRTPTVDNVMATGPVSVISGTWDDADARQLKVKVDESTYVKGTDGGLSVSGGTWKLALSPPLGEGKHTVSVETVDAAGNISAAVVPGAVNVDATPPAAPTVNAVASGKPVDTLTGTYDSKDATTLTVRCGLTDRVRFELGSALDMPFADGAFDVVWTQHAVMNIEDRATLYRECARVLRPGGRLVFHDILAGDGGALDFPVPWAVDAGISFIYTEAETKAFLAGAGLELVEWRDETEAAIAVGLPPAPPPGVIPFGLMVVLGPDLPNRIENLARAGRDGRVRVVRALYRKR